MQDDEADLAAYDADAARAEAPRSSTALVGCLVAGGSLLLAAALYFGFFAAVVIEQEFFGSDRLVGWLPESVLAFLEFIYRPLIWALDQFDG